MSEELQFKPDPSLAEGYTAPREPHQDLVQSSVERQRVEVPAVISDEKMKVLLKEFVKARGKLSSWVFPLGISIGLATGKLVKMYLLPKLNLSINICLAAYAAVLAICLVIFIFTAIRAVFYLPAASIGGLIKKIKNADGKVR